MTHANMKEEDGPLTVRGGRPELGRVSGSRLVQAGKGVRMMFVLG